MNRTVVAQLLLLPEGVDLRAVLGVLVAVFTVGEQLPRRISLLLTLLVIGSISALQLELVGMPLAVQQIIQTSLALFAAWFVGDAFRAFDLRLPRLHPRPSRPYSRRNLTVPS